MGILEVAELNPGHVVVRWSERMWYFVVPEPERIRVWVEDDQDDQDDEGGCGE